jgi:hypothetical protein
MRKPQTKTTPLHWQGLLTMAATAALVAGCGGGGSSSADPASAMLSVAKVIVRDAYGAPIAGASVKLAAAGGADLVTDSDGVVFVAATPGAVELSVTVPTFLPTVAQATLNIDGVTAVAVTLQRATAAAGGSLATRSGEAPVLSADGRTLRFEVELVVVGADAQPVEGLSAADFALLPCLPDLGTPAADCLRNAAADRAYLASGAPTAMQVVAAQPVVAHSVGLLIDQSGSIASTDGMNARLYAAKALLGNLTTGDQGLVGAFADGAGARLPQQPLTVLGQVANAAAAAQVYPSLDALASQSGGQTPLYTSIDAMRALLVADTMPRPGLPLAMAVFTDGADTYCGSPAGCAQRRQQVIDAARADTVRLFTIGLSGGIDVEALSQLATATGGAMLYADKVEQLIPLYGSLGRLMSMGLATYRLQFTIDAGETGVLASGQTVLARARVLVRGQVVDIPLAVGIP